MVASLDEFASLYATRPVKDNVGGMKAPHMFAVWFMARKLSLDLIVESGVWKGQSTWLLRKACPEAKLISIDLNLRQRECICSDVLYSDRDFSEHDWDEVTERSLAFFDDHQNAYKRLQQCRWFGFKQAIFEDNYPVTQGDCYSLKKAFAGAGFQPAVSAASQGKGPQRGLAAMMVRRFAGMIGFNPIFLTPQYESATIAPNEKDSRMLRKRLEIYYEFPPVFKTARTRWGDEWDETTYPTPAPLLEEPTEPAHRVLFEEAVFYTWVCYVRLK